MKKSTVIGLGLVVAVGIGVAYFAGIYPPRHGMEGTIGAAKRYQSPQITDQDVVLQDPEVQAFLQSDTFHQLASNPEFRKVAHEEYFKAALLDPQFGKLVSAMNPELNKVRDASEAGKQVQAGTADAAKQIQAADAAKQVHAVSPDAAKAAAATSDAGKIAAVSAEVNRVVQQNPELGKAVNQEYFKQLMADPGFARVVHAEAFSKALATPAFMKMASAKDNTLDKALAQYELGAHSAEAAPGK